MRLKSISITNYRSITTAKSIILTDYSVILGKNNEGKTNVLNAIRLAMTTLRMSVYWKHTIDERNNAFSEFRQGRENLYNFQRDYPVSLQNEDKALPTRLVLKFTLNDEDIAKFRDSVGVGNNGSLSIEIKYNKLDKSNKPNIKVLEKRGKGAETYKEKIDKIIEFLACNIFFQYIPAVRTEERSMDILNDLVNEEFANIRDDEYNKALEIVQNKQDEIIKKLSKEISDKIKVFLPDIDSTEICLNRNSSRYYSRNAIEFFVNDGNRTNLSFKGEGIKSLITLALLNSTTNKEITRIVAIEEPESHLHPEAIHQIHNVLQSISDTNQVIITTHNGVFVNRLDISSNIIVDNGKGEQAKSLSEIRELLGVQLSDNLVAAEVMIIVEGSDDMKSFRSIFSKLSNKIKNAIKNKKLDFTDLGGATNLKYKCSLYASLMCKYYAIVDGDKCGISSYNEAIQKGLLSTKNCAVLYAYGDAYESEFEDFLKKELYQEKIFNEYGVDINKKEFKGRRKKWSDRLKETFLKQGKVFTKNTEAEIKMKIAGLIESTDDITNIFPECYLEVVQSIATQIEELL